jgi:hypothetical protein
MNARSLSLAVLVVTAVVVSVLAGETAAATLYVRTNGVDTTGCGGAGTPCRSITAALERAADGSRIVVGPGRYGNGVADPGDESTGRPCNCLVYIDKRITLESEEGAAATIIDAGSRGHADFIEAIRVVADGVVIGKPGKGFTLARANHGLAFDDVTGATIAGNHATRNLTGFFIIGRGHRVTRNLATENRDRGFFVYAGADPFGHTVSGNVVTGSKVGFDIQGFGHVISGNVASANTDAGFSLNFGPHTFTGNSAIGNDGPGIWSFSLHATTITRNNIHGNDPSGQCGLRNTTGGTVLAPSNFWGAASGPGDPVNGVCDEGTSVTITAPAAARDFAVNVVTVQ